MANIHSQLEQFLLTHYHDSSLTVGSMPRYDLIVNHSDVFVLQHMQMCLGYGQNEQSVNDALNDQRRRTRMISDYKREVDGAVKNEVSLNR